MLFTLFETMYTPGAGTADITVGATISYRPEDTGALQAAHAALLRLSGNDADDAQQVIAARADALQAAVVRYLAPSSEAAKYARRALVSWMSGTLTQREMYWIRSDLKASATLDVPGARLKHARRMERACESLVADVAHKLNALLLPHPGARAVFGDSLADVAYKLHARLQANEAALLAFVKLSGMASRMTTATVAGLASGGCNGAVAALGWAPPLRDALTPAHRCVSLFDVEGELERLMRGLVGTYRTQFGQLLPALRSFSPALAAVVGHGGAPIAVSDRFGALVETCSVAANVSHFAVIKAIAACGVAAVLPPDAQAELDKPANAKATLKTCVHTALAAKAAAYIDPDTDVTAAVVRGVLPCMTAAAEEALGLVDDGAARRFLEYLRPTNTTPIEEVLGALLAVKWGLTPTFPGLSRAAAAATAAHAEPAAAWRVLMDAPPADVGAGFAAAVKAAVEGGCPGLDAGLAAKAVGFARAVLEEPAARVALEAAAPDARAALSALSAAVPRPSPDLLSHVGAAARCLTASAQERAYLFGVASPVAAQPAAAAAPPPPPPPPAAAAPAATGGTAPPPSTAALTAASGRAPSTAASAAPSPPPAATPPTRPPVAATTTTPPTGPTLMEMDAPATAAAADPALSVAADRVRAACVAMLSALRTRGLDAEMLRLEAEYATMVDAGNSPAAKQASGVLRKLCRGVLRLDAGSGRAHNEAVVLLGTVLASGPHGLWCAFAAHKASAAVDFVAARLPPVTKLELGSGNYGVQNHVNLRPKCGKANAVFDRVHDQLARHLRVGKTDLLLGRSPEGGWVLARAGEGVAGDVLDPLLESLEASLNVDFAFERTGGSKIVAGVSKPSYARCDPPPIYLAALNAAVQKARDIANANTAITLADIVKCVKGIPPAERRRAHVPDADVTARIVAVGAVAPSNHPQLSASVAAAYERWRAAQRAQGVGRPEKLRDAVVAVFNEAEFQSWVDTGGVVAKHLFRASHIYDDVERCVLAEFPGFESTIGERIDGIIEDTGCDARQLTPGTVALFFRHNRAHVSDDLLDIIRGHLTLA